MKRFLIDLLLLVAKVLVIIFASCKCKECTLRDDYAVWFLIKFILN